MPYVVKDKVQFLAEASKILSSSLDYNVTLSSIANLVVKNIADFCIIDLFNEEKKLYRVVARCADNKKQKLWQQMFEFPPDPRNKQAIYQAGFNGKSILVEQSTDEWLKKASQYKEEREITKKLGMNSFMFIPLISRGKVIGVLSFISSSKNYTTEDVVLAQELASRSAVAVDNARLFTEAQEALQERDEFLTIASHELRTPLTSIILNLQTALQDIQKYFRGHTGMNKIVEMLMLTEQQSKRLSKLINDLLNVSLVTTDRLGLEKENLDLSALVKDVLMRFDIEIKKSKTKITVIEKVKNIVGFWDKIRLGQVISNLLTNALKYGKKKPITIELKKDKKYAILIVKDRGIGIKQEDQKEIFARFKRAVTSKEYKGLGVGLYISKQIVRAHGGTILLKSKLGKGATFIVSLPLNAKEK